ncbi:alpha/beta hydrolase [Bartonella apis]|uniref:alpha/beta hydrolase n=1 Tax=Bartonella apis TaxID=1686310 RepID=UPI00096A4A2D|nr:alpha/beta hydrolase-fold protein [Bartonella apis]
MKNIKTIMRRFFKNRPSLFPANVLFPAKRAGACHLQVLPFSRFSFSCLKMSALFVASLFFGLSCGFANAENDNTEKMRILTKDIEVSLVDGHSALLPPEAAKIPAGSKEDGKENTAEKSHENDGIRRYRLFIAVPEKPAPRGGFPLVLLLDGNTTFKPAIEKAPDAVIVAIGYPTDEKKEIVKRRFYELTSYAPADKIPLREGMEAPKTGGDKEFRSLIEKKILPEVFKHLPVNRDNITFFGHSLGGLFVMKSFLSAGNHGFATYCAADPSIWWNGHEFMEKLAAYNKPEGLKSRLLIETSGIKTHHKSVTETNKKPVKDLHSGPNGKDVSEILRKAKAVDNTFYSFSDKNHGTMLAPAIKDCLQFALNAKNFKPQRSPANSLQPVEKK